MAELHLKLGGLQKVVLDENLHEILIQTDQPMTLQLESKANTVCSVYIRILQGKHLTIQFVGQQDSQTTLLYWNETKQAIQIEETNEVKRNATLLAAYGQLASGEVEHHAITYLQEEGASASLHSAVLAQCKKQFQMDCIHQAPRTFADMQHYSIVLEGGRYKMEATGKIEKYARGSSSHQTSRAMTFSDSQTATILPQLLIDENEVEASHATTVGQMDENQMYYLQSRGLSKEEAMKLVTIGYLMPIAQVTKNERLQKQLQQEIEMKVNEACLISIK